MKLGDDHRHYATVTSTNDVARRLAAQGAPAGTIITADHQSSGRGRLGRPWLSEPGQSLLMSVVLRPRLPANRLGLVTVCASLAAAQVIEETTPTTAVIKWPNDVLIGDRKVCGILLESAIQRHAAAADFVVVGIGVNVNQSDFPAELEDRATSILLESGQRRPREELAGRILTALVHLVDDLPKAGAEEHLRSYERRLVGIGKPVELWSMAGGERVAGLLQGVGPDGELLIADSLGATRPYYAGDATMSAELYQNR